MIAKATKLCRRCEKTLPLSAFSNRQNRGKVLKHTQCRKCRNELHFIWLRKIKEQAGNLFASTRRYDPARADRLDDHRNNAKLKLPISDRVAKSQIEEKGDDDD